MLRSALAVVLAAVGLAAAVGSVDSPWTDPQWLVAAQRDLLALQARGQWMFGLVFFALFTLLSALAVPGCSVLALAAGLCFGGAGGTLMVVLASTVGASLSFLVARHLLRDLVRARWGDRLGPIEAGLARDGPLYLFSLRVMPVIPYPLLNPLMGLSAMRLRTFFGYSLLGMLPGSAAYVLAGTELAGVSGLRDLLSAPLLASLALLALMPWMLRHAWQRWRG